MNATKIKPVSIPEGWHSLKVILADMTATLENPGLLDQLEDAPESVREEFQETLRELIRSADECKAKLEAPVSE
jgi:hypothetical protein